MSDVVRPILAPSAPDQVKIDLLRAVLARLESGEQFTAMAILLTDGKYTEMPFDGHLFELLHTATRLIHRVNMKMDENNRDLS